MIGMLTPTYSATLVGRGWSLVINYPFFNPLGYSLNMYATMPIDCIVLFCRILFVSFGTSSVFSYVNIYMFFKVDKVVSEEVIESNEVIDIILVSYLYTLFVTKPYVDYTRKF
jgi:hypothetical protein